MRPPRLALLLPLAPLALGACKTPQEKLVDRRHELRAVLDEQYSAYAGPDAQAGAATQEREGGILGRVFGEVDRSYFEQQCLAVGRGERPLALTSKLDAFLRDPSHVAECRKAAELQADVDALQRQIGER